MFRSFVTAARALRPITNTYNALRVINNGINVHSYCTLTKKSAIVWQVPSLYTNKQILDICKNIAPMPVRTVTKFSFKKGKRKTVKAVTKRFFRLHWGGWIRTQVGRQKHLWKKTSSNRRRLRQHQFCTGPQTNLLEKMVTKFWKRPKYYVDDPYIPYHTREEFRITRKKPL